MTWTLTHSITRMRNSLRGGDLCTFSSARSLGKSSIIDNHFGWVNFDLARTFMLVGDRHSGISFHRIEKFWSHISQFAASICIQTWASQFYSHSIGFRSPVGSLASAREYPFLANN